MKINTVLVAVYRIVAKFLLIDITYVFVKELDLGIRPAEEENAGGVYCQKLSGDALSTMDVDKRFKLNAEVLQSLDDEALTVVGAFEKETLVGWSFFQTGRIEPSQNRANDQFQGIGIRLPQKACYMYKVFVLPECRGRKVNRRMMEFASQYYSDAGVTTWVTTTDIGNSSFYRSVVSSKFRVVGIAAEYKVFGKWYFKLPKLHSVLGSHDFDRPNKFEMFHH